MNRRRAFTLIELLIVVAIIAILAAIAVPNSLEAQVRSKVARVKSDMRATETALESYAVDNSKYPSLNAASFGQINRDPFRNLPAFGVRVPEILRARPDALLETAEDFDIWCETGFGGIESVEAVISYTATGYADRLPITDLRILELRRVNDRWSATLPSSDLGRAGTYNILYTAVRDDGFGLSAYP